LPRGVGQIGASSLDCVGVATFHDDEEFAAEEPDVLVIGYLDDDLVWVTVGCSTNTGRDAERVMNHGGAGPAGEPFAARGYGTRVTATTSSAAGATRAPSPPGR